MFDFRYHALSLVAVFLALGIGIVLGVTIGDSLVSEADRSLRQGLRGDVIDARDDERRARDQVERRDELIDAAFPLLVDNRLRGQRVAIVAVGSLPDDVEEAIRDSVEEAGGDIDSITALPSPPDLAELGEAVGGRFERAATDSNTAERLGARLGVSIVEGGPLADDLEDDLSERFSGRYDKADSVVYWHTKPEDPPNPAEAFEDALLQAMVDADVPVVGVERSDTDPSQVGFYSDRGLSSVDSIDLAAGGVALVLALDGEGEGRFGLKDTAESPIPGGD